MADAATLAACAACGTQLAPNLRACPGCATLVHAEDLRRLAAEAEQAAQRGDVIAALGHWRAALELLPDRSRQHAQVVARVTELTARVKDGAKATSGRAKDPDPKEGSWMSRWGTGLAGAGLLVSILSKGKLLLLGLTKAGTLLTMLASVGVYWTLWGWPFALGFVLSIYVHEIGHVAALRRLGFPVTAPMFIPGVGAVVRLKQQPASPREDAVIGLAGPVWGLAASAVAWALHLVTHAPLLAAIGQFGAWVNVFNLLPVWQLDGSRGMAAMSRSQRVVATAALGAAFAVTGDRLLLLLIIVAAIRVFGKAPAEGDRRATATYVFLVLALSALSALPVPGLPAQG